MVKSKKDVKSLRPETQIVVTAREYSEHGMVNPAVYRASTVLYPDVATIKSREQDYVYGRRGTPTSRAFETAVATLEDGFAAKACPSGLAAISTAFLAFLKSGDHLLIVDTAYHPARLFCDSFLTKLGVDVTYYDPLIGGGITELMKDNTRVVYCESPGSQTMEVQDIPAIAEAARRNGAVVMLDNTWSGGRYFNAFAHGCDVSIQAATKYIVGHSDAMLGVVTCNEATWPQFKEAYETLGQFAGPDDMYLGLRGLRTIDVRLERHQRNALIVAEWLRGRPEVSEVLYPALPGDAGHKLWKRDFTGASGLFSVTLNMMEEQQAVFLDNLTLFGMGYSWGGFESLAVPFHPHRSAVPWANPSPCIRFHIGLENPQDLMDDLKQSFARIKRD
jgi:cystathionine beta-lyase